MSGTGYASTKSQHVATFVDADNVTRYIFKYEGKYFVCVGQKWKASPNK